MIEVWKPVKDYEGLYEVSNLGRVRSIDRYVKHWRGGLILIKGTILKPYIDNWGYEDVQLKKHSKGKHFKVHRLVGDAFIPNPNNLPEIDHIDGDRSNNKSTNIRWTDRKTNMANPITRKRIHESSTNLYKPVCAYTKDYKFIKRFDSIKEAASELKCGQSHIGSVCKGERQSTGGYIFRYCL